MTIIHTATLPDGSTETRKSKGRNYAACVVVVYTKAANDAERATLDAKLAEAQAHLDTFPAKSREEIKAAATACSEECRAKYDHLSIWLPLPDGARGLGPKNPEYEPTRNKAWAEQAADVRDQHNNALGAVESAEYYLKRIPADGLCAVNSWHMSLGQAQKTAGGRSVSMARMRTLDKVSVVTDIAVRETAGKKAGAPKNVTPKRLEGLRLIKAVEEGRDPRSLRNSVLYGRVLQALLAMGLVEEGGKVTITGASRNDNPDAEFYWGVRDMQLYKLTDAGRTAVEAAS